MPLTILHHSTIQHTWLKDYDPVETRDALFGFEFPFSDWPYVQSKHQERHGEFRKYQAVMLRDTWHGHSYNICPAYAPLQEWWCAVLSWMQQKFGSRVLFEKYGKRSENLDIQNPLHLLFTLHDQVRGALQANPAGGLYSADRIVEVHVYLRVLRFYLEQNHPGGIEFKFEDYRVIKDPQRGLAWDYDPTHILTEVPQMNVERAQKHWRTYSPWAALLNQILGESD